MHHLCELILLLLVPWLAHSLESPAYNRPSSYSTIAGPTHFYRRQSTFVPSTYTSDMQLEESKRRESSKRYSSKKIPFKPFAWDDDEFSNERFNSAEFSEESNTAFRDSTENDSREYAIGTQIRVQHPITETKHYGNSHVKPTKPTSHGLSLGSQGSGAFKSSSYSEYHPIKETRHETSVIASSKPRSNKYTLYDSADSIKIVPPPKSTSPISSYNVYEPDQDDYEPLSSATKDHSSHDRFKGVASKKQVEKYIEDQQKMLDKALKMQILNDPRFQQYVKSREKERLESETFESEEVEHPVPPPSFRPSSRRRRPQASDFKRPLKGKPPVKNKGKPIPRRYRSAIVISV